MPGSRPWERPPAEGRETGRAGIPQAVYVSIGLLALALTAGAAIMLNLFGSDSPRPVSFRSASPITEAYRAYAQKDYAMALEIVDEQLKIWKGDDELRLLRLRVLLEMGRVADARKLAASFQEERIEGIEVFVTLAEFHRRTGDANSAEACLEHALDIRKDDPYLWKELALLHHAQRRLLEALASCQESLRLDPDQADLRLIAREITLEMGRVDWSGFDSLGQASSGVPTPRAPASTSSESSRRFGQVDLIPKPVDPMEKYRSGMERKPQ